MPKFSELREILQKPRKNVDTWYGRHVMRRVSIYVTWFLLKFSVTPNQATFYSLIASLLSCFFFALGHFGLGILFLNLWYLVDHVDGEIARYTQKTSATGFFFDTVLNFIVQPLSFAAIGWGLYRVSGVFFFFGLVSAFGSLMLMILPACEDSVKLALINKAPQKNETQGPVPPEQPSQLKRLFSVWHQSVLFPNVLLGLTALALIFTLFQIPLQGLHAALLIFYGLSINAIWILQLAHKVKSGQLDH